MKQIPNLFTLLNLFLGCLAIVFILQTGETIVNYNGEVWKVYLPERVWWGSVCIGLAAVVDFLDGWVARLFKADSAMGKELDSLADVVSFGVAPGLILFQLLRISYAYEPGGIEIPMGYLLPAFLLPLATAWRLARFNTTTYPASGFMGVPAPAAGLLVASFPMILLYNYFNAQDWMLNKWMLYGITLVISYLMISRLPLLSLKTGSYKLQKNIPILILLIIAVVSALVTGWLAVPIVFVAYILVSLLIKKQVA